MNHKNYYINEIWLPKKEATRGIEPPLSEREPHLLTSTKETNKLIAQLTCLREPLMCNDYDLQANLWLFFCHVQL